MRIIAGSKRGMKLLSPKGRDSRPITDRVKESLFSVLNNYDLPERKMVADVFSGVGSLGLESLSRGAAFVTFVEKDVRMVGVLRRNIASAGFAESSRVISADAYRVGAPGLDSQRLYELVFVDPPYAHSREFSGESRLGRLLESLPEYSAVGAVVVFLQLMDFIHCASWRDGVSKLSDADLGRIRGPRDSAAGRRTAPARVLRMGRAPPGES